MKYLSKGLVLAVSLLVGVSQASAGEWQIVGPRALGMGGANVAVANDATASYWNPGAFGFFDQSGGGDYGNRSWSGTVGAGVGVRVLGGLGEQIDKIDKIDFKNISGDTILTKDVTGLISLIDTLNAFDEDMGVNILANGGLRMQSGHFGLGGVVFANISAAITDIDLVNLGTGSTGGVTRADFIADISQGCSPCTGGNTLTGPEKLELQNHLGLRGLGWNDLEVKEVINALDASLSTPGALPLSIEQIKSVATLIDNAETLSGGLIENNTTQIRFSGVAVAEIPLTYGHAFSKALSIGGNIKYMKARVYNASIKLLDDDEDDEFGDSLDTALDDYTEETNFGIDLGLLYRFGDNLRLGLVGRNLNAPTFGDFKEEAQLRAGFAYKPLSFVTIAADADLMENEALGIGNISSQNIAVGLEIRLFKFLMLRAGAYKNIAENDIGPVYTAGLGINLWLLNIDVGLSQSEKKTDFDGDSVPEEAKGAFAISMLF